MAGNFDELIVEKVRNKLNTEKVKLWLPPYTTEDGSKGEISEEFLNSFGEELSLGKEDVATILEELRQHALKKLAAKRKFQEEGIATIHVKLAGNVTDNLKQYSKGTGLAVQISLLLSGCDLKYQISTKTGLETEKLKVICGGKIVEDGKCLQEQQIKHGNQMMALVLSETQAEAVKDQNRVESVAKTREAAELLASHQDGGKDDSEQYYLQIADQRGKPIDLPPDERKALVLAMTLHEKGKAALKRKELSEALLLLLEADREFIKCRADILTAVDNFGLLCLDVVWCYLLLKNVSSLPDAEARLKACDASFKRSYGPHLERLALIKGGTGSEKALFMRLHLLQGVLAYHQRNMDAARALLGRAESELKALTVDDESMNQVMAMGFSDHEARVSLRMCEGNIQLAVSHIMKRREEKTEIKEDEKKKKRTRRLEKRLGPTADGKNINVEKYDQLIAMGFSKGSAAESLKQANNDLGLALQVLQDHPELLSLPDPDPPKKPELTDEMLAAVVAMGFDGDAARAALSEFAGSVERAVEYLVSRNGVVPPEWMDAIAQVSPSTSSSSAESSPTKTAEEKAREKEAVDRIIPDIPEEEEEYLDLTLEEEAGFLQEYMALIVSQESS